MTRLPCCVIAAFLLLGPSALSLNATTIDPLTWEELVLKADFVGIVECEVAGGIVAQYKVVESWKGRPKPGERLSVRVATDYWGPQFPVVFCGERFFVTGFRRKQPTTVASMARPFGMVPLWWRSIPADVCLPLWQGLLPVPDKEKDRSAQTLEPAYATWAHFKAAATSLIKATPAAQELRLMQSLTMRYVVTAIEGKTQGEIIPAPMGYALVRAPNDLDGLQLRSRLCRKVLATRSVRELLQFLETARKRCPDDVTAVIRGGGRSVTRKLMGKRFPAAPARTAWPSAGSKERGADGQGGDSGRRSPGPALLKELREDLARGVRNRHFGNAFVTLTIHDPASIAAFLRRWPATEERCEGMALGYQLASYFGWRCAEARAKHLRALLNARHPYIRAAAATYLAFEDGEAGIAALRQMSRLKDDPGSWAALNLARRGVKAAVPRALEVLRGRKDAPGPDQWNHQNLQLRLLLLLSNSARHSGLSPPPVPRWCWAGRVAAEGLYDQCAKWWEKNAERLRLYDPWLPLLEKQKID